jgi:hypothetical protein
MRYILILVLMIVVFFSYRYIHGVGRDNELNKTFIENNYQPIK